MMGGMTDRPQKITFAELRDMGVRGVLVYCADYRCNRCVAMSADEWQDDVRLSDIELLCRLWQAWRGCTAGLQPD
jgi:hypothetical protein